MSRYLEGHGNDRGTPPVLYSQTLTLQQELYETETPHHEYNPV